MFSVLLENLLFIGVLVIMYLGSLGANTLFGIYHNLSTVKEDFSKEKLFSGLIRGGIVLVGSLLVTGIISLLPEVLAGFGITTEAGLFESISVVAMGGVMATTIVRYLGDALKKLYLILGSKNVNKEES